MSFASLQDNSPPEVFEKTKVKGRQEGEGRTIQRLSNLSRGEIQKFFEPLPSQKQKTHHGANTEVLEGVGIGAEIPPDKMPDHEGTT